MPKKHELTDAQKMEIVALEPHFSHAEIGEQLQLDRSTITKFIERYKNRNSIENLSRPGRPRKTSKSEDRWLIQKAESQTKVPFKELKNIVNIDVSKRTLQRRLCQVGIRKWRAVTRVVLTKEHAKKRLAWAHAHEHFTVEDWRKVIWSDECLVKRDSDSHVVWVFRRQTKSEKYASKNIKGKRWQDSYSVMMWGCFIGDKLGPIAFFDGMVHKENYVEMLSQCFLSFLEALHTDDPDAHFQFQHDNATPHIAVFTRNWLSSLTEKYNLTVLDWPPNSPDLNLIENLWSHIKQELYRRYPDTTSLTGSTDTVKSILRQRLQEIWWDIGADLLNRLIESMPERVKAVKRARGWYTEF